MRTCSMCPAFIWSADSLATGKCLGCRSPKGATEVSGCTLPTRGRSTLVSATTLDDIRIECVGEARAVRCPGSVWVEYYDAHKDLRALLDVCERILEAGYPLGMHHSELVNAVKSAGGEVP